MAEDYTFYSGGYSSLNPNYGNFVGYRLNSSVIGSPTGIQTANQINEVVSRIREGVKNVELQPIQPEVFEQIPKQHFKEISQVSRLAGVKPSIHAPIIDAAGFGERGYEGDKARGDAEARLWNVIEKAHDLDEKGRVPVVIHSTAGIPGSDYRPEDKKKPGESGRFRENRLILINQETRELVPLEEERKYYPNTNPKDFEEGRKNIELGGTLRVPRDEIETLNLTEWDNKLANIGTFEKNAREIIGQAPLFLADHLNKPLSQELLKEIKNPQEGEALNRLRQADLFVDNARMAFNSLFHKAYKYANDNEERKKIEEVGKEYSLLMSSGHVLALDSNGRPLSGSDGRYIKKVGAVESEMKILDDAVVKLREVIEEHGVPQVYKPVEEFAKDKAAETFGNLAFKSVKEYKESAPFLAIENMYQGMAFSRAEDMQGLIDSARKKFVENAVKSVKNGGLGMDEKEAKKRAEEVIGMTLDVGHLNMMRKHGFSEEDVIKEAGKMAKMVKHVHLTDNFGYSDSHLPPGMGNVPLKDILKQLEKDGKLQDFRAIVEAGTFVQHFKKSPYTHVLSAFGSPIYGPSKPVYWNQTADVQGGYFGSPMAYFPEKHFSLYGSGFSGLPEELGGQMPGTQSKFAGTPSA
jgi:sugar phosphate isomerase/epimerase